MVRGCQKKIIFLKNTQSEIFDEAYLVIKDNALYENMNECDMVEEANKIIEENFVFEDTKSPMNKILGGLKNNILPFAIGFLSGILLVCIVR